MKAIKVKSGLHNDNRGMTLAELLIVLAILGIVAGLSGIGISLVHSRDSERCAKLIDEALEETRRDSMTMKGTFTFKLEASSGTLQIISSESGIVYDKALPREVEVRLETQGGTVDIRGKSELYVEFDKSTGRVKKIQAEGIPDVDGTILEVRCSYGSKSVKTVMVRSTGKHYLDYEG